MPRLRLALAFALLSACLQARAQSPSAAPLFPAPQGYTPQLQTPPITTPFVMPKAQTSPTIILKNPQIALNHPQIAKLNGPCYAMRSYNFTPGDLLSDAPRPSTSSSCTAASPLSLKQATAAPAK